MSILPLFADIVGLQTAGKIVCVVDVVRRFDVTAAATAGVDMPKLLVSQPDDVEQAREIVEALVRSGAPDVVIVVGTIGRWTLRHVQALAQRSGTEVRTVDTDALPAPLADPAEVEAKLVKVVRAGDRKLKADPLATAMDRLWARVEAVHAFCETRPAHYALAWGVQTGRLSSEMEAALRDMAPTAFARAAMRIAKEHGGKAVRDIYEAWRELALAAMPKDRTHPEGAHQ